MPKKIYSKTYKFEKNHFQTIAEKPSATDCVILPLLMQKGDKFKGLGTCFVIDPLMGWVVTAKHNLEETLDYKKTKNGQVPVKKGIKLLVQYASLHKTDKQFVGSFLIVRQVALRENLDIAILKIDVPVLKKTNQSLLAGVKLDFSIPEIGSNLICAGFYQMDWNVISEEEKTVDMAIERAFSHGIVSEIHFPHRDKALLKFPCFRMDAEIASGMSGGPIFNETGGVCGINLSSFDLGKPIKKGSQISYGAHISSLLFLTAFRRNKQNKSVKVPLLEMINNKQIQVEESFWGLKKEKIKEGTNIWLDNDRIIQIPKRGR